MRIFGVDPGSRLVGWGCVDVPGGVSSGVAAPRAVAHGVLRLHDAPLAQKLHQLREGLAAVLELYRPDVFVVERVFFARNAMSALKLGQARGVALLCGAERGLPIFEYSPTEVKKAVAGHGLAGKDQVAQLLQWTLGKMEFATGDASDALALAVCHAHHQRLGALRIAPPRGGSVASARRGRSIADAVSHRLTGGKGGALRGRR